MNDLVVILHGFILQLIYTTQNRGINITFNKTFLSVPIEPKKICLLETLMSVEVERDICVKCLLFVNNKIVKQHTVIIGVIYEHDQIISRGKILRTAKM